MWYIYWWSRSMDLVQGWGSCFLFSCQQQLLPLECSPNICNRNWHVKFCSRLRDREKSRDWSTLEKKHRNRSWSAESYQGEKFVFSRKPQSPQHLPRLENRPTSADSNYHQDLKRGILNVIPPVPVRQQNDNFER